MMGSTILASRENSQLCHLGPPKSTLRKKRNSEMDQWQVESLENTILVLILRVEALMDGRSRGKVNKTRQGQTILFLFCLPHCVPCLRFQLALCLIGTSHLSWSSIERLGEEHTEQGLSYLCSVLGGGHLFSLTCPFFPTMVRLRSRCPSQGVYGQFERWVFTISETLIWTTGNDLTCQYNAIRCSEESMGVGLEQFLGWNSTQNLVLWLWASQSLKFSEPHFFSHGKWG